MSTIGSVDTHNREERALLAILGRILEAMRLRIDLSYDGGAFHGWARQPGLRTVQGVLEDTLAMLLRLPAGDTPRVTVAGRTDTGVHALGQVCHVDIAQEILDSCIGHMNVNGVQALHRRLMHVLPDDIAVQSVSIAPEGFDARFSALDRTYVYRISDAGRPVDPRMRGFLLAVSDTLDCDLMNQAAAMTIGLHDFGSFATPNPGGTTIREVKRAHWDRIGVSALAPSTSDDAGWMVPTVESGLVCFTIVADAFAHNMVRSLVNACVQVGRGRKTLDWFNHKMDEPIREGSTGPIAACGLTLEHVEYPQDDQLAVRAAAIRAKRTLE